MSTSFDDCAIRHDRDRERFPGNLSNSLTLLKKAVSWPIRVFRARREFDMLARLSETELKDIGLTRSDLGDATALSSADSPSTFLAARVEERYRARRQG